MSPGHLQNRRKIRFARHLQKRSTIAEALLWNALRGRQIRNLKFRRQSVVGPFIVDFLCIAQRLIIEVDGRIHDNQLQYDLVREERLQEQGYRIIRFSNDEVENNIESVLARIEQAVFGWKPSPRPSPCAEQRTAAKTLTQEKSRGRGPG